MTWKRIALASVLSLLCLASLRAGPADDVKGTIAYVQKLQTSTGGFLSMEPRPEIRIAPTLRATSSAVRALHYLGGEVPKKDACIKFVESCFDPASKGFSDFAKGKPDVFTTAVAVMALIELKMPLDKYRDGVIAYLSENVKDFDDVRIAVAGLERLGKPSPKAAAWTTIVEKEGTRKLADVRGFARQHASVMVTRLRLGKEIRTSDTVIKNLQEGQRLSGGFGKEATDSSDLETTYRVMRAFVMLKGKPKNVEGVRSFVAKCRNDDGGYGLSPAEGSNVSATYFAAIIRHWLKDMK